MAGSIKGIIVEIGGDTSGLQKALSKVNSATSSLSRELKGINSLLKLDPKNTELLKQKQDVLNKSITTTEGKLKQLQKLKEEADKKMAEGTAINEENYRYLQREIINTQNKLSNLKNEASNWTKAGDTLVKWGDNLNNISSKIDSLGNKLTTRLTLPITAAATAGMTYNAQIEKYETAFKTFLGSADKAATAINNIKEDARKTPFDTASLVRANQMLISTGVSAEDARADILALGEAVIATGGGNDELTRMASNLQQIKNAGKATAMDIRQFAYAGIDVYGILADYTGKSTEQVKDMTISYEDLTKALKKASSKGGKYFGSMTNASETLTGQISAFKSEVQDAMGELTKSLMPTAKKVVSRVRELTQQFDKLSDSQKENIVKIGLMVAAAGPLLKVAGTLGTTIGTTAKGIGTLTKAIGLAKNGIGDATGSAATLAKMFQNLATPTGLATVAITAAAGAMIYFATKETEAQKEARKFAEEMTNSRKELEDFNNSIDKTTKANLGHIDSVGRLKNELTQLVDENGKVKKGYEGRVAFILHELNDALGTEYKLNGNIIQNYKELRSEIDKTIEKKKAEIKLNAEEEKYKKAIQNQNEDIIKLKEAYENLGMSIDDAKKRLQELRDYDDATKDGNGSDMGTSKEIKHLENLISAYENAEYNVKTHTEAIIKYENDYANFVEGNYDKIGDTIISSTENWTETSLKNISQSIREQSKSLKAYKEIYEKTGNEVARESAIQAEKNIKTLAEELAKRTTAIDKLGKDEIRTWQRLAFNSYGVYYDTISKMPEEQSKQIQEMTRITLKRTPELVNETKNMADQVIEQISKDDVFKKQAMKNMTGFLNGLSDSDLRFLLNDAGVKNVDAVINGIRKGNLAESEGEKILQSLKNGLDNPSWKNSLWNTARGIASSLSSMLTVNAKINVNKKSLPGHKSGLDYVPYDDYIARLHKGERVLTADENKQLMKMEKLSQLKAPNMKTIGNAINNHTKMVYTTPNITFNVQKMDEANLNAAFSYINRRLGSSY